MYGLAAMKQNENQSQLHFRADCKAQVKELPLFCKTIAPVSAAVSLRTSQTVAGPIPGRYPTDTRQIPGDAIHSAASSRLLQQLGGPALRGDSPSGFRLKVDFCETPGVSSAWKMLGRPGPSKTSRGQGCASSTKKKPRLHEQPGLLISWQGKKDSNLRMLESKSSALTSLATPLKRTRL